MRRAWAAGLLALAAVVAASAAAQTAEQEPPALAYETRPTVEDITENFPRVAYNRRREGQALLCCLIRENGTLQCAVVAESPIDQGFGEAARRVAGVIRLTPESAQAWRDRGQPLRVPISFRSQGFTPAPAYDYPPRCGTPTSTPDEDPVYGEEENAGLQ